MRVDHNFIKTKGEQKKLRQDWENHKIALFGENNGPYSHVNFKIHHIVIKILPHMVFSKQNPLWSIANQKKVIFFHIVSFMYFLAEKSRLFLLTGFYHISFSLKLLICTLKSHSYYFLRIFFIKSCYSSVSGSNKLKWLLTNDQYRMRPLCFAVK